MRKLFAMFLNRRDRPQADSPKRHLLNLLARPTFRWLWTPETIYDYERGAHAVESDERIIRRAESNRTGFELLIANSDLRIESPCPYTITIGDVSVL